MKIKGHDGKGNPVEFTPEEKVVVMLKDQIPSQATDGKVWWLKNNSVTLNGSVSIHPNSNKTKYANNSYKSNGTLIVCVHDAEKDKLLNEKQFNFEICFEDCVDNNSMPDMTVTSLVLQ